MGGLVPRTESAVLGGLAFTADFYDFRTHGQRIIRIDDLSAPSGRFAARVSASVVTVDRCSGRGRFLPGADTAFASVFAVPTEVGTGSAETPAAATTVAQPTPFSRSSTQQGTDSVVTTGPIASTPVSPGSSAPPTAKPPSDRISTRTHRHTATAAGNAPPAVDYGFGPGGARRPAARRANTPPRVPRPRADPPTATPAPAASPVPTVPIPSDRDREEPVELPSYDCGLLLATCRLHLQS